MSAKAGAQILMHSMFSNATEKHTYAHLFSKEPLTQQKVILIQQK